MVIKKPELYKFKRFFLAQVELFTLVPKANIQVIAWCNGSGKTSLLSQLTPLPPDLKNEYREDGYKL